MQTSAQIIFRNMARSDSIETDIRDYVDKLTGFYPQIINCRVVVEAPHKRHHQGNLYQVRIDISVPGNDLVVGRNPGEDRTHEDIHVAVRDSFSAMRRQLENQTRIRRGEVKSRGIPTVFPAPMTE